MKTLGIISLFLISGILISSGKEEPQETKVYICNSDSATKYHYKKDCRGLNNCKHDIKYVTLSDAKLNGKKTLCGWED